MSGTFDPVHWGHLLIAETALSQVELDQVIWVLSPCPPHKQAVILKHRLEMVQQAIADHPAFVVSIEAFNYSKASYAIETLIGLQAVYPNTHGYWIVGLNSFQILRWYRRQELAAECDWLVAPRIVSAPSLRNTEPIKLCTQVTQKLAVEGINIYWPLLQIPWVGVSSSLIRKYCHDSKSSRYLVPEAVREYIATHNVYSQPLQQGATESSA